MPSRRPKGAGSVGRGTKQREQCACCRLWSMASLISSQAGWTRAWVPT